MIITSCNLKWDACLYAVFDLSLKSIHNPDLINTSGDFIHYADYEVQLLQANTLIRPTLVFWYMLKPLVILEAMRFKKNKIIGDI